MDNDKSLEFEALLKASTEELDRLKGEDPDKYATYLTELTPLLKEVAEILEEKK